MIQTGDLGVGSKCQTSLNIFESVGIYDDAPSSARSSLLLWRGQTFVHAEILE